MPHNLAAQSAGARERIQGDPKRDEIGAGTNDIRRMLNGLIGRELIEGNA